ncbi:hypothetical protein [Lentiprolixibacter aurantiacus]|uniref:Uncharacterized protein n=1 Tax=Lentiprolixibacter aurantiacus TaxID=2993939 RepID=A0AAE3MLS0_9FLAO|nr:hypothetical protein [Lentiprolixibacter aurantiacus]MCX2720125.1 hypothetical protein [Lentiprolixibacter aurantiacus]
MKLSSFFLALLLLFQGMFWNLEDASRIGVLIEHAKFHSEAYGDSFMEFLSKHYGEFHQEQDQRHQEEQSQHENLPLQNHSYVLVVADITYMTTHYPLQHSVAGNNTLPNFHYQINYASLTCSEIFQPPRLA